MTILHEIAHCVLDHGMSAFGNSDIEEAEAKFFAKYMAAPPPLVDKIHPTCPEDIMDFFCISRRAASIAFTYYCTWLRVKEHKDHAEYEDIIIDLFVTKKDRIRQRLSAYSDHITA